MDALSGRFGYNVVHGMLFFPGLYVQRVGYSMVLNALRSLALTQLKMDWILHTASFVPGRSSFTNINLNEEVRLGSNTGTLSTMAKKMYEMLPTNVPHLVKMALP